MKKILAATIATAICFTIILATLATADAARTISGTWFMIDDHPDIVESITAWVNVYDSDTGEYTVRDIQDLEPVTINGVHFFQYPFQHDSKFEQVKYNTTQWDWNELEAFTQNDISAAGSYRYAPAIVYLHQQNILQDAEIKSLQEKLGKQGKRIADLEQEIEKLKNPLKPDIGNLPIP